VGIKTRRAAQGVFKNMDQGEKAPNDPKSGGEKIEEVCQSIPGKKKPFVSNERQGGGRACV